MKKIYLIGMPGSGKTTLGKQISSRLNLPFIDLDNEIIKVCKNSINEIFKDHGEPYFREVERRMLVENSKSNHQFIMATGGGAPCFFDNMEFMNNNGLTVFFNISVNSLFNRLKDQNAHRPLLKDKSEIELKNELRDKINHRLQFYNKSKIILHNDNITHKILLNELEKYLGQ